MSTVKDLIRDFSALTPSERREAIDGFGVVLGVSTDPGEVRASAAAVRARVEPVDVMQAAAAARRVGVKIDPNTGKVDRLELDAALAASGLDPLARITTKNLLYKAGALDD